MKQIKHEVSELILQANIYREMYRVLKTVVCAQYKGLKS
jgi:hypothetical protein